MIIRPDTAAKNAKLSIIARTSALAKVFKPQSSFIVVVISYKRSSISTASMSLTTTLLRSRIKMESFIAMTKISKELHL